MYGKAKVRMLPEKSLEGSGKDGASVILRGSLVGSPTPHQGMCTLHSEYAASNNGSFYSTEANPIGSVKTAQKFQ